MLIACEESISDSFFCAKARSVNFSTQQISINCPFLYGFVDVNHHIYSLYENMNSSLLSLRREAAWIIVFLPTRLPQGTKICFTILQYIMQSVKAFILR